MNIVKGIACLIVGHNTRESKSIVNAFSPNNWIKRCNRCGAYIMHSDIGSITLSEREALKAKKKFEEEMSLLDKAIMERRANGKY